MITVTLHTPAGRDEAEADTPEAAIFAARTLWDEAVTTKPVQGFTRACSVVFTVDDKIVRRLEGIRP